MCKVNVNKLILTGKKLSKAMPSSVRKKKRLKVNMKTMSALAR
jgi:hypothetical protein